jgi:hypothetical protein
VRRITVGGDQLTHDSPVSWESPMHTIKLIGLFALMVLALATAFVLGHSYRPDLSSAEKIQAGTAM